MSSTPLTLSRRTMFVGAAAALLPMQQALSQTRVAGGDWLAMVKAHHAQIAKTFDDLLAAVPAGASAPGGRSTQLVKTLGYQLTAHSVAEENVLYPMLAMQGMVSESDKLYLDQAHAKVGHAGLMAATMGMDVAGGDAQGKVRALRDAVLKHAKEDEEGNLYPKLQQKLDAKQNAMLTAEYQKQFGSVKKA